MNEKTLEQQLKEKQKEIDDLKKKLEDRNPAFNGNLLMRSDKKYKELCDLIGKTINQCLGQEYTHIFIKKNMVLNYESSPFTGRGWTVWLKDEDMKKCKSDIADIEMKKFQESLDNFSWAVNNQGVESGK